MARTARRKGLDVTDLLIGIGLAVLVPLLAWIVLSMAGLFKTKTDLTRFREKVEVQVPPDAEEVNLRLAYAQRMYNETASVFLRRFLESTGVQRERERRWAIKALSRVQVELSRLESLINSDPESRARFAGALAEIHRLKSQVSADLGRLQNT